MSANRRARWGVFLRSFAIQGSFNYRTLIGAGFAFALLPVLRAIHGHDEAALTEAVRRHSGLFNSHPYLSAAALGAVARMEEEGRDVGVIERFKMAVRGSLGTLGDRVFWAGWRPICVLAALGLLALGLPWWAVVGCFLVVYNAGHIAVRVAGFRLGLSAGFQVGERLRSVPLGRVQQALTAAGAFFAGLVVAVAVGRGVLPAESMPPSSGPHWGAAAAVAAVAGIWFGTRLRTSVVVLLGGVLLLGITLGM
jgi:mannose/fructose/N-acetylgalactosamine-specific phosphotransferase system component IID